MDDLDFSSRFRTAGIEQFVVIQNHHGIYAILQILEIKDDSRGELEDYLKFKYWIIQDGASNSPAPT